MSTSDALGTGSLLDLPPELRLNIYEYVFSGFEMEIASVWEFEGVDAEVAPWVMATCRLIRAEAMPLYTAYLDQLQEELEDHLQWLRQIIEENEREIESDAVYDSDGDLDPVTDEWTQHLIAIMPHYEDEVDETEEWMDRVAKLRTDLAANH